MSGRLTGTSSLAGQAWRARLGLLHSTVRQRAARQAAAAPALPLPLWLQRPAHLPGSILQSGLGTSLGMESSGAATSRSSAEYLGSSWLFGAQCVRVEVTGAEQHKRSSEGTALAAAAVHHPLDSAPPGPLLKAWYSHVHWQPVQLEARVRSP